jgi:hypothetical protein
MLPQPPRTVGAQDWPVTQVDLPTHGLHLPHLVNECVQEAHHCLPFSSKVGDHGLHSPHSVPLCAGYLQQLQGQRWQHTLPVCCYAVELGKQPSAR